MDSFRVADTRFEWSPWVALETAFLEPSLPDQAGLYRIRRIGGTALEYIGQTGVGIRQRVRMLRGIAGEAMPYRDPHTAGPALWALLQSTQCTFEVSCLPVPGSGSWRRGLEAVAIAHYRQQNGRSPAVNFGRMPSGYRMSSANNSRLVAAGKRFQGGPTGETDPSHLPGVAPVNGLDGDVQGPHWCGHTWSEWRPLSQDRVAGGVGLYRIRGRGGGLAYVGEGAIRARLAAHLRKTVDPHSAKPQDLVLREQRPLECSTVVGSWQTHQRRELETDLIAAHILSTGAVPAAQFIG